MRLQDKIAFASARVPAIVTGAIAAAVGLTWADAPAWPAYLLAGHIAVLALLVWAHALPRHFRSKEELGFTRNRDMLLFGAVNESTPTPAGCGVAFLCFFGLFLTFGRPPSVIAGAAWLLMMAWMYDRIRFPADKD